MVRLKPFRALRPGPGLAEAVASPPYDVLDSKEARDIYQERGEKTFLRVIKPEIDLPVDISQYDERVYEMGKLNLQEFIQKQWLVYDDTPGIYVYAQQMGDHIQYGVCAGVPVEDYAMGIIKRHEKTQVKKENDRTRLTYVQNANAGPVFLTYRDAATVDSIISSITSQPPSTSLTADDGIKHFVWPVLEPHAVSELCKAFEAVPCSYIADGHHRSASAFRVGEMKIKEAIARGDVVTGEEPFNFFLAVLFPSSQLKIMEYNRVVRDLNNLPEELFLERVRLVFECEELEEHDQPEPPRKGQMGMCLRGKWYRLTLRPEHVGPYHPVNSLDVQVLYDKLLHPILNVGNPRTDERIKYVGGIRGSKELQSLVSVDASEPAQWAVAFAMYPVSIEEVMAIADAEELMSPKATWFEPKLSSGLVVRTL